MKAEVRPGRLDDGDGLYLVIRPGSGKSWVCRVQRHGNRRDFCLGSASKVSLAVARERAREVRAWKGPGLDPVLERQKILGHPTFREASAKVLSTSKKSWRNTKHEGQWVSTMEAYASPHMRLVDCWPRELRADRARSEKLKEAYVKARYPQYYRISEAELAWLGACVEELGRAVHTI